eukprot:365426-Chlamydomonas_euryale.AAC.4
MWEKKGSLLATRHVGGKGFIARHETLPVTRASVLCLWGPSSETLPAGTKQSAGVQSCQSSELPERRGTSAKRFRSSELPALRTARAQRCRRLEVLQLRASRAQHCQSSELVEVRAVGAQSCQGAELPGLKAAMTRGGSNQDGPHKAPQAQRGSTGVRPGWAPRDSTGCMLYAA